MTLALDHSTLAALRLSVVCDHCDLPLYLRRLVSGVRAYGNTCGCRLRPLAAAPIEDRVAEAIARRVGVPVAALPDSLLHEHAERLHQVRVGVCPEEVICTWNT